MLDEILSLIKGKNYEIYLLLMDQESLLELIKEVDGMEYYRYKNDKFMFFEIKQIKTKCISIIRKDVYNELMGL